MGGFEGWIVLWSAKHLIKGLERILFGRSTLSRKYSKTLLYQPVRSTPLRRGLALDHSIEGTIAGTSDFCKFGCLRERMADVLRIDILVTNTKGSARYAPFFSITTAAFTLCCLMFQTTRYFSNASYFAITEYLLRVRMQPTAKVAITECQKACNQHQKIGRHYK